MSGQVENDPPLSVIAIDHLPSLVPREAGEAFSATLLPRLLQLTSGKKPRCGYRRKSSSARGRRITKEYEATAS